MFFGCLPFFIFLNPDLIRLKSKAYSISCKNSLKMIGVSLRMWSIDHQDLYPFNVSTNQGGTRELCSSDAEGFESNPVAFFRAISEYITTPRILRCPADFKRTASMDWASLGTNNISYLLRSSTDPDRTIPDEVIAICPIHGLVLRADGSVEKGTQEQ